MFKGTIANDYDSWYEQKIGKFIDQIESTAAMELFQPQADFKVLDAGCGTGNFSFKLAKLGSKVCGIDISTDMLNIARQKLEENPQDIDFQQMDLYNLSFPDNYFDAVFSMAAFEFIKEPQKAYKELSRVAKPGAKILIGTINRDSKWGKLYQELALQDPKSVFNFADFKNLDELKRLDKEHLVDSRECLFIPPGLEESSYNHGNETALSASESPGFIITLYQNS